MFHTFPRTPIRMTRSLSPHPPFHPFEDERDIFPSSLTRSFPQSPQPFKDSKESTGHHVGQCLQHTRNSFSSHRKAGTRSSGPKLNSNTNPYRTTADLDGPSFCATLQPPNVPGGCSPILHALKIRKVSRHLVTCNGFPQAHASL